MTGPRVRIHGFVPRSRANGPGLRAVVWAQGCTLGCPGCFNPETHDRAGPEVAVDELFERISLLGTEIEGVTISGGEPLQQRRGVLALLDRIRAETTLSSILITGYAWDEIARMPDLAGLADRVDVVLAGRYQQDQRIGRGLRGSANKTTHLCSDRYTVDDLDAVPDAEVIIRPGGEIMISGIDPPLFDPVPP